MGKTKQDLRKVDISLFGFVGRTTNPVREINLLVVLGEGWNTLRTYIMFIVVHALNLYNTIFGRKALISNMIITCMCHQDMKL